MNKIVIALVLLAIFAAVIVGLVFLMKYLNKKKNTKVQETDKPQQEEPEKEKIPLKKFIDELLGKDSNIRLKFLSKVNLEKLFSIVVNEELKTTMIKNALHAIEIVYGTKKPCDEYNYLSGNHWTFLSWLIYRDTKTLTDGVSVQANTEFLYTLDSSKAESFNKNLKVLDSYMDELLQAVAKENDELQKTLKGVLHKLVFELFKKCNDACWNAAKHCIGMVTNEKTGFLPKLIDAYKKYENQ